MLASLYLKIKTKTISIKKSIELKNPSRLGSFTAVRFFLLQTFLSALKYFIIIFKKPYNSFQILVNQHPLIGKPYLKTYNYSFNEYTIFQRRIRIISLSVVAVMTVLALLTIAYKNVPIANITPSENSIYNITVSDITRNTALIGWKTVKDGIGYVEYGRDSSYSMKEFEEGSDKGKKHSRVLVNLDPNTSYHFRIKEISKSDNSVNVSENYTFSTLSFPEITDEKIKKITGASIKVAFNTNIPTDTQVFYRELNKIEESLIFDNESLEEGETSNIPQNIYLKKNKADLVTNHEIIIDGLEFNREYDILIKVTDADGNTAQKQLPTFTVGVDLDPAIISDIKIENTLFSGKGEDIIQTIIGWKTDEPATSQVSIEEEIPGFEKRFLLETEEDKALTKDHAVVLTTLEPGGIYYIQIISKDAGQNKSISDQQPTITPKIKRSFLDKFINGVKSLFNGIK